MWIGKNLEVQPKNNSQKSQILNLHTKREKLDPNLCFTVEDKAMNLNKIRLLLFQVKWIKYSITSNFKNLSMNLDTCWKSFGSFPAGRVIYNKDVLIMYYSCWDKLVRAKKKWKVYKHSLKYKILEVEFNSSSWSIFRNSRSQIDVIQNRCS